MEAFWLCIVIIFSAILGSFLEVVTWRLPRNKSFIGGRSECPHCKKMIAAYDNIPLLSYLVLNGKCRHCKKKIPIRAPLLEVTTIIVGVLVFVTRTQIRESVPWIAQIQWAGLPMLFILAGVLIAITVIDIEHMIIPDSLSLGLFGVIVLSMLLGNISIFGYLFAGFLSASLLLLLNFATKGKGMGLGDVKLALPLGAILGIQYVFPWFVVSFVLGGIYGMAVLLAKQAKLRDKVPFGPFLVLGFFIILIFGQQIKILFPFPIL